MHKRKTIRQLQFKLFLSVLLGCLPFAAQAAAEPGKMPGIRVKHVYKDAVYLEAGSSSGLSEGQRLLIKRGSAETDGKDAATVAEIEIESVTPTSAVGRVVASSDEILPGDTAVLPAGDPDLLRQETSAREIQKYAQVVSFTDGIPPEQEIRESIPKAPLPEINRIQARIGLDYGGLWDSNLDNNSWQFGYTLRLDAQRLGGTHWSISGYHRGRFLSRTNERKEETLTDLMNRTYNFSIKYDNPGSRWTMGAGRLYVPWASSLSTIDGFYLGRRFGKNTVGVFGGSTPNPSSWNYDPDRQLAGAFVNFDYGNFENWRLSSTSGVALSWIHWQPDRQFGFFENGIFYKHYLSIFSNVEADLVPDSQNPDGNKVTLSRSYFTLRVQPHKAISFDINENYFRSIPSFDPRLIGTGLVDQFLFQGLSGGVRLELPARVSVYGSAGQSSRTGDARAAWNYLGGASIADILRSGIRAEYKYSRFDGSFGKGNYQTVGVSRLLGEGFRFEVQGGRQALDSAYTAQTSAWFVNGNVDWYLGSSYFMGFGTTVYRGDVQSYNQYFMNFGYRFDNRRRGHD